MHNKMVIGKEKDRLVKSGLLTPDDELFTKNAWRKRGCKVNKGENPITIIPIYVFAPHKVYDKCGNCTKVFKMLNVKANFYKNSQVSPIQK